SPVGAAMASSPSPITWGAIPPNPRGHPPSHFTVVLFRPSPDGVATPALMAITRHPDHPELQRFWFVSGYRTPLSFHVTTPRDAASLLLYPPGDYPVHAPLPVPRRRDPAGHQGLFDALAPWLTSHVSELFPFSAELPDLTVPVPPDSALAAGPLVLELVQWRHSAALLAWASSMLRLLSPADWFHPALETIHQSGDPPALYAAVVWEMDGPYGLTISADPANLLVEISWFTPSSHTRSSTPIPTSTLAAWFETTSPSPFTLTILLLTWVTPCASPVGLDLDLAVRAGGPLLLTRPLLLPPQVPSPLTAASTTTSPVSSPTPSGYSDLDLFALHSLARRAREARLLPATPTAAFHAPSFASGTPAPHSLSLSAIFPDNFSVFSDPVSEPRSLLRRLSCSTFAPVAMSSAIINPALVKEAQRYTKQLRLQDDQPCSIRRFLGQVELALTPFVALPPPRPAATTAAATPAAGTTTTPAGGAGTSSGPSTTSSPTAFAFGSWDSAWISCKDSSWFQDGPRHLWPALQHALRWSDFVAWVQLMCIGYQPSDWLADLNRTTWTYTGPRAATTAWLTISQENEVMPPGLALSPEALKKLFIDGCLTEAWRSAARSHPFAVGGLTALSWDHADVSAPTIVSTLASLVPIAVPPAATASTGLTAAQ
ncbi:hypothetical protein HDU96_003182, partial [Phlyctochytrium bullatum]